MKLKSVGLLAAAVAGLTLGTSGASAASVTLKFINVAPGTGSAGQYNWTYVSDTISDANLIFFNLTVGDPIITNCIQLGEYISYGSYYTYEVIGPSLVPDQPNVVAPLDATKFANLKSLYNAHYEPLLGGSWGTTGGTNNAILFQQAVWDVVGAQGASGVADTWAEYAKNNTTTGPIVIYQLASNATLGDPHYAQDQIWAYKYPGSGVPLPAAAGVGFSMLGGFGVLFAFKKRMSRKSRIA